VQLASFALALAGLFAGQITREVTRNAVPTDRPIFAALLVATALIMGELSFLAALTVGPILDRLVGGYLLKFIFCPLLGGWYNPIICFGREA
jgi:K+-transporting ATPase A subunit